jgi:hypothetical protein
VARRCFGAGTPVGGGWYRPPSRATNANVTSANTQKANSARTKFLLPWPDGALNLRAQNLALFTQIADGVDDRTWDHHLRAGDYSRWFRDKINDGELADEIAEIESDGALSPSDSRRRVKEAIDRRYSSPA